uniref:Uncharacterized protein n=1 Tax=Anguilla anguilla TaxID=7936 RepID=A0A0E9PEX4_ANGAN
MHNLCTQTRDTHKIKLIPGRQCGTDKE